MASKSDLPSFETYFAPTVAALKAHGGSATIEELEEAVAAEMNLSDAITSVPHGDGPRTQFQYELAWVRTYLKKVGAAENSEKGVWRLTPVGLAMSGADLAKIPKKVRSVDKEKRQRKTEETDLIESSDNGKSGDGGIDGIGVLRLNLLSFHVFFQCKRWKGSVGASTIRDFRGAMVGRADKGLVITTATFTTDARREATRDGAPAIDLVDGDTLCDLLKRLKIGVSVEQIEHVIVDESVFSTI
jgi:restriction system protein